MLLAAKLAGLLAKLGLFLMNRVLPLLQLLVLIADIVFVFAFQLDELLFCLKNLLLFDVLRFKLRFLDYGFATAFHRGLVSDYVNGQGHYGTSYGRKNIE